MNSDIDRFDIVYAKVESLVKIPSRMTLFIVPTCDWINTKLHCGGKSMWLPVKIDITSNERTNFFIVKSIYQTFQADSLGHM